MTVTGVATCPSCGAGVAAGDAFCEACGETLVSVPAAPSAGGAGGGAAGSCASCGAAAALVQDGYCGECGMKQPVGRDHLEAVPAPHVAAVTDKGRRHHRNEDAFAVTVLPDGRLAAVVCDGVSSSSAADVASQAACDVALPLLADDPAAAYAAARDAVAAVPYAADSVPPSCTYLAALVDGGGTDLWNLGDCRAYWLPAGAEAVPLTADDALPGTHTLTKWLGEDADPEWAPAASRFEFPGAGRLLLCSDGLWNYADRPAAGEGDPLTVARALVDLANGAGGADNITVVVVDVPAPRGDAVP
ncbi:MAG TPA: protein phosphatase 2C domain-containing protein [Mycobacteriales bacterium]|jgi:serine/threonine protein phosphatase PrpC